MDNCGLYIAKVVGTSTAEDSRLQVKVLPFMEDLASASCPKWPFFFKDELYSGKSGELVWCICDDHFNVGFILGPANYYTNYSSEYSTAAKDNKEITLSISESKLLNVIYDNARKVGATVIGGDSSSNFTITNMKVTYWDSSCIHFVDRTNGGSIIAYSSGSLLVMTPSEFFVHIGAATDSATGTTLKINTDGISLMGSSIKLQGEEVSLGKNPKGSVLVTEGATAESGKPSDCVKA